MGKHLKVIIDYDGTLTAEETQVAALAEKSLDTLAGDSQPGSLRCLALPHATCSGTLQCLADARGS